MTPPKPLGVDIVPYWRIVSAPFVEEGHYRHLWIEPGPGFGDGRHETTELCLQAVAALAPRERPWRMLDFGSGSGILAIAAARLGAKVDAIEIDPLAASHGERNALANAVADRVDHARTLGETRGAFDFIVANILRSVILDFADALTSRLAKQATLVLSGLVSTDVPEVSARYASQLGTQRPEVYERGDWRALVWRNLGDVGAPEVQSCAASSATLGRTTHSVGSKRDRAEKPDNGQGEHG